MSRSLLISRSNICPSSLAHPPTSSQLQLFSSESANVVLSERSMSFMSLHPLSNWRSSALSLTVSVDESRESCLSAVGVALLLCWLLGSGVSNGELAIVLRPSTHSGGSLNRRSLNRLAKLREDRNT